MAGLELASASAAETRAIAAAVAAVLEAGDVVVLAGDLGGGKTTFVQGAAAALGCNDRVTSPTFALVQEYAGRTPVAHVDVYRLTNEQELYDVGFAELVDSGAVLFVEWGDRASRLLPDDRLELRFEPGPGDDDRVIAVRTRGARWESRAHALDATLAPWRP